MDRYFQVSDIIKNKDNKRYYSSLKYPNIELKDTDIYIYGKRGLRLDLLAYRYYGDVELWFVIARANNLGKGSLVVPPGKRIRIPYPITTDEVLDRFFEINEKE